MPGTWALGDTEKSNPSIPVVDAVALRVYRIVGNVEKKAKSRQQIRKSST